MLLDTDSEAWQGGFSWSMGELQVQPCFGCSCDASYMIAVMGRWGGVIPTWERMVIRKRIEERYFVNVLDVKLRRLVKSVEQRLRRSLEGVAGSSECWRNRPTRLAYTAL
jgi:hypothetical protein